MIRPITFSELRERAQNVRVGLFRMALKRYRKENTPTAEAAEKTPYPV